MRPRLNHRPPQRLNCHPSLSATSSANHRPDPPHLPSIAQCPRLICHPPQPRLPPITVPTLSSKHMRRQGYAASKVDSLEPRKDELGANLLSSPARMRQEVPKAVSHARNPPCAPASPPAHHSAHTRLKICKRVGGGGGRTVCGGGWGGGACPRAVCVCVGGGGCKPSWAGRSGGISSE